MLSAFLLLNYLIPISMNVALEGIKAFQSFFLAFDSKMNYEGIPCNVLNMSIIEELGIVDYILTDKTGTLTMNEMKFEGAWIPSQVYNVEDLHHKMQTESDDSFMEFWLAVLLCHDVVLDDVTNQFQGSSPDEVAFVRFARQIGFIFQKRLSNQILLQVGGKELSYEYITMIPFTPRKRMSVIVRNPLTNKLLLYTKGADNSMFANSLPFDHQDAAHKAIYDFSIKGLRTLVFGKREVSESEVNQFLQMSEEAKKEGAQQKEDDRIDQLERGLEILGVSAIEDRLQDGIPETLKRLRRAGMKIMMITGDKLETAENIGYLSQLISEKDQVIRIKPDCDLESTLQNLIQPSSDTLTQTLIVEGVAIQQVLQHQLSATAISLCSSAIFCRSSPKEKAAITRFIKENLPGVTLAIGDGGNDVGMIQEAHIGIGLVGKEGNQAASAGDFSFGQFR